MAVVFISPKQRQKMFFIGITVMLLLFLISMSFGVFLSGPKEVSPVLVFNKPKVDINMAIFDSDEFKNLQPFAKIQTQYIYRALTKDKRIVTGFMPATSFTDAGKILEGMGLEVINIGKVEIGRDNPFTSYYQPVVPPTTKTTTKK